MAMQLRYAGEFLSRPSSTAWRVEIYQEAGNPFSVIGELAFDADEALVIEWPTKAKHETICGSTAVIRVNSPGDRTYTDLYTMSPGSVRMDVYRAGALYWSGTLDPEFYEEPYERLSQYTVALTFSDFGVLQRVKNELEGMPTLEEIVVECIAKSGIRCGGVDQTHISARILEEDTISESPLTLSRLRVRADNFADEEGERLTLEEALTGILQPLALRIVQRCGKVYVYDLNGLFSADSGGEIEWNGDGSTLGVDRVYNNVRITWSPYVQSGNIAPSTCWKHGTKKELVNLSAAPKEYDGSEYFSYYYTLGASEQMTDTESSFTIYLSTDGENAEIDSRAGVRFFKTVKQNGGDDAEGIALAYHVNKAFSTREGFTGLGLASESAALGFWHSSADGHAVYDSDYGPARPIVYPNMWIASIRKGIPVWSMQGTANQIGAAAFKTEPVWLPPVTYPEGQLVKITLNMLLDPRFNPFAPAENADAGVWRHKDWQTQWKQRGNFVYVPVTIKFKEDETGQVYCWDNRDTCKRPTEGAVMSLGDTLGRWIEYDETHDGNPDTWGWLCYYGKDRKESAGVANGWAKNRQAVHPQLWSLPAALDSSDGGQFIPFPPFGNRSGRMWIEVRKKGWMVSDGGTALSDATVYDTFALFGGEQRSPKINWVLFKLPEIEVVNNIPFGDELDDEDVEYSGELAPTAKEELEIETICGSSEAGVPMARGAYFFENGKQLTRLERAGIYATVEQLLIGTLCSQFSVRCTTLRGDVELRPSPLTAFHERNQGGKRFLMAGERQDCITDTSDATFVEFNPDEYEKR